MLSTLFMYIKHMIGEIWMTEIITIPLYNTNNVNYIHKRQTRFRNPLFIYVISTNGCDHISHLKKTPLAFASLRRIGTTVQSPDVT